MACKTPTKFFKVLETPALPTGSMKGKVALVTGGGTGLGRAIATMFSRCKKTAAEIRQETGGICEAFKMDVKNAELVSKTVDDIESKFGSLPNILVNNAAGNFIMATNRLSPNAIKTVVDIVLLGTMNVTTEIGRRAIKKGTGCAVLSISTPYARHGAPFVVPSAISKAGVENMSRSLASEWAKYGFRFNVIAPGPIPTEGAFGRLSAGSMEDSIAAAAQGVPEGRVGQPVELANLAAFICSDYGSWLNGAVIDFDGGQQFQNHPSSFGPFLHDMDDNSWQQIEDTIRGRTGKEKKSKL